MSRFLCALLAAELLLSLCACAPEVPSQPENDPPPVTELEDYESVDWLVISLDPEDYGIVYDIEHMNVRDFPLAKLCVYCLYADGAYAEGAHNEFYRRFMEAPNTVLNFLALLGNRTARGEYPAAEELCRQVVLVDVFWYDGTEELTAILKRYQEIYPQGRQGELLNLMQAELAAALERQAGEQAEREVFVREYQAENPPQHIIEGES